MFARTDNTTRHNRIVGNVMWALTERMRGSACQVFAIDVKLHIPGWDSVYYPDVLVVCGMPIADGTQLAHDAAIVVEVLSDSTEVIDRREKLIAYKRLPSLRAFLLIAQAEQSIEVHARNAQGQWAAARYGAGESIDEAALGGEPLSLAAVYAGTDIA